MINQITKFIKTSFGIFLTTYFGLAIILVLVAFIIGNNSIISVGNYFMNVGIAVFIITILIFGNPGNRFGGIGLSAMRSDERFKKVNAQESPVKRIALPISVASILLAATGIALLMIFPK